MSHRVAKRVLGYFTLFLLSGAAASAAQIELKSTVSSPGSLVLLGDLAKITGDDAREIEQLKRLELFPAPAQGTSRVVRRGEIQELLRLNEIDLRGHHFTGATVARIVYRRQPRGPRNVKLRTAGQGSSQWYVVTTRSMSPGEIVRPADVSLVQQQATTGRDRGFVKRVEDAVDLELVRRLPAGQPIQITALRRPLLVRRNEIIKVVSRASGVRVQTEARATQNGSLGDLIVLQALNKGRERYMARVAGSQLAEVYASGVQVSGPPSPPRQLNPSRFSARKIGSVSP